MEPLHALAGYRASAVGGDGVVILGVDEDELAVVRRGFVQRDTVLRGDMAVGPAVDEQHLSPSAYDAVERAGSVGLEMGYGARLVHAALNE